MGWPLAVSAGMMEKSPRPLVAELGALAAGHLLAMFLMILPFSLLISLVYWQRQIRIGASVLVMGFGAFRLGGHRFDAVTVPDRAPHAARRRVDRA
jgi:hypothetical protein